MATFRFLHCADLHLDSPLIGLEADPDVPADRIRGATRAALVRMIDAALEHQVDFVVAAGDLYDGDWQDWRTGHFLTRQVARLSQAGIPFIAIRGNHDAESHITRHLRMPHDAHWLSARKPETVRLEKLPVAIHGQSFATRAVTDNIARNYPAPDAERFNIGVLHTAMEGNARHDNYAPCTLGQLQEFGYDYWALGHVHERAVLSTRPWIVFPGNLQGRHVNETGAKGATLVTVADNQVVSADPLILDTVRWIRVEVPVPIDADEDEALGSVRQALAAAQAPSDGRLLAARITLTGATAAHAVLARDLSGLREKIRNEATSCAGPDGLWVEAVRLATRPAIDPLALLARPDAVGALANALAATTVADLSGIMSAYADLMLNRSPLVRRALDAQHPAVLAAGGTVTDDLLSRARDLLMAHLAAETA